MVFDAILAVWRGSVRISLKKRIITTYYYLLYLQLPYLLYLTMWVSDDAFDTSNITALFSKREITHLDTSNITALFSKREMTHRVNANLRRFIATDIKHTLQYPPHASPSSPSRALSAISNQHQ
jgi:hypothetical protein